jgi:hypothetical protein
MLMLTLIGAFCVSAVSQAAAPKYEVGTIIAVQPHPVGPNDPASVRRYEISVKVGITLFVVLYDRRPGATRPEYQIGLSLPVLVRGNTMTFHDRQLGRTRHLPILSRKTIPENNGLMQFFV